MAINLVPFLASNTQNIATCMRDQKVPSPGRTWQWRIQGRPPLIFRRNCGPKGLKYFFSNHHPPPPPPLSEGLDPLLPRIACISYWKEKPLSCCLFIIAREKDIHYACASSTKLRDEVLRLQNQILGRFRHAVRVIKKLWSSKHSNVSQQDWSENLSLEF